MMNWWHYLLLVNLYLVLFFGFYRTFLHRETFFQLNRVYLVAGSLLSFLIPLMQADWIRGLFITQRVHQTIYTAVNPEFIYTVKPVESNPVTLGQIIAYVYVIGVAILLGRLVYQLLSLKMLVNGSDAPAAFSFFKKIRVDDNLPNQQTIIEHEQVHMRQWHSADVLLIEAVMIVNWFNPVVYLYRKAIKHVHEYIADRKAIETGTSKTEYALLLLSQTFGTNPHQLTNNFFNHSLLKQRILMLNQNESGRRALLKYGLSAPLFAAMLILSSATVNNSKIIRIINKKSEQLSTRTMRFTGRAIDSIAEPIIAANHAAIPEENRITDEKSITTVTATVTNVELHRDSVALPDADKIFNAVELQPNFPGGEQAFRKFLVENIHYPVKAKENGTTGRVFIQFIVQKDGALTDMKCLRDPGDGLGQEAMRALEQSPKWKPGIENGKTVKVQFTVPVNFSLANDDLKNGNADTIHSTAKKTAMVFMLRHDGKDTLGKTSKGAKPDMLVNRQITTIKLNGRTVTKDELYRMSPKDIESMSIINADTAKMDLGGGKKIIIIKTKDVKASDKG